MFRQLDLSLKDSVARDVLQLFQHNYRENAARNVVLANELTSMTDALTKPVNPNRTQIRKLTLFSVLCYGAKDKFLPSL